MVGGEHGDDRLRVAGRGPRRRGADGGGAVAPLRLEQDRRLGADLRELLGDAKPIVEIGDDDRRLEDRGVADQADDRLKRRTLADQRNELLGQALAQFGPHARPRSAAHDHWQDFGHRFPAWVGGVPDRRPLRACSATTAPPRQTSRLATLLATPPPATTGISHCLNRPSDFARRTRGTVRRSDGGRGGGRRRERKRKGRKRGRQRQHLRDRPRRQRGGQTGQRAEQ